LCNAWKFDRVLSKTKTSPKKSTVTCVVYRAFNSKDSILSLIPSEKLIIRAGYNIWKRNDDSERVNFGASKDLEFDL